MAVFRPSAREDNNSYASCDRPVLNASVASKVQHAQIVLYTHEKYTARKKITTFPEILGNAFMRISDVANKPSRCLSCTVTTLHICKTLKSL